MKHASGILLFAPDGKVVVQRRDNKAPTSPNMLSLFGGGLEPGEQPLAAAYRELSEETSLDSSNLAIKHVCSDEIKPGITYHLYRCDIPTDIFEVYEGVGSEKYSISELSKRVDTTRGIRRILEEIKE